MSKMPPRQRLRPWKYAQACTTSSTTIPSRWLSGCLHLPILLKRRHHPASLTKRRFKPVVRMPFITRRNCAELQTRRRRRSLDLHHGRWSGLRTSIDVNARNLRLRLRINVDVPANINARISHLTESNRAALEHASAATAAGQQGAAKELLGCEIPEGQ